MVVYLSPPQNPHIYIYIYTYTNEWRRGSRLASFVPQGSIILGTYYYINRYIIIFFFNAISEAAGIIFPFTVRQTRNGKKITVKSNVYRFCRHLSKISDRAFWFIIIACRLYFESINLAARKIAAFRRSFIIHIWV